MCGRYTITGDLTELEKLVRFICKVVDFKPRYNLAPRSHAPILIGEGGTASLKPMRWGLIPSWSKDETIGDKRTDARADTISEKPTYPQGLKQETWNVILLLAPCLFGCMLGTSLQIKHQSERKIMASWLIRAGSDGDYEQNFLSELPLKRVWTVAAPRRLPFKPAIGQLKFFTT
jgi:hypothetical protein